MVQINYNKTTDSKKYEVYKYLAEHYQDWSYTEQEVRRMWIIQGKRYRIEMFGSYFKVFADHDIETFILLKFG